MVNGASVRECFRRRGGGDKDAILEDEADAELQARIDADVDVAGACCPACEDSHRAIGSGENPVISKGSAR